MRGSIPGGIPTDPTIYRFYEMVQVYGTTLRALVHEQFGDGIISAINFKIDIKKVEDPDGGSRAVITLDGKFLPYNPFWYEQAESTYQNISRTKHWHGHKAI